MRTERFGHTAGLLRNGQILVAGGDEGGTAELFDPKGELFLGELMVMGAARSGHAATLFGQGSLFLTGGGDRSAEYYRIGESRFNLWPNGLMEERRGQTATELREDKRILVVGGVNRKDELVGEGAIF